MNRPVRGAFRFAVCAAVLAVGCGGRTTGSGGTSGSGSGEAGSVVASAGGATGAVSGSTAPASGSSADEDAGCTEIEASSYDQSCKSDSDCVTVNVGNACAECAFVCAENVGAINAGAKARYTADVAKTPAGVALCSCPSEGIVVPCCRSGQCHADNECSSLDGSTAADAGPIEGDASAGPAPPPSCAPGGPGMTNCGPGGSGTESCCTSLEVPGGTFYRSYDGVSCPGGPDAGVGMDNAPGCFMSLAYPATVSGFRLDKYEVTVGRFRQFVNAVVAGWLPAAGSGKHAHLNKGLGLVNSGSTDGYENGWNDSWGDPSAGLLPTTQSDWTASLGEESFAGTTWTAAAGAYENLPVDDVTWYQAYAFCIWDGGFLPSEAEWNFAASGGSEQRVYPWSTPPDSTTVDCSYANYTVSTDAGLQPCVSTQPPNGSSPNNVGSESPKGDGKWGQADLAGNVYELNLDAYEPYVDPCTNCANLNAKTCPGNEYDCWGPVDRGGVFLYPEESLLASARYGGTGAALPDYIIGFRCARTP